MGKRQSDYIRRGEQAIRPENQVGHIRKPYGQGGELAVNLFDTFPEDYNFETEPLWVEIDSLAVPLFVKEARLSGGGSRAVFLFDDFGKAGEAEMLTGLKLYAEEPAQPEDEERQHELVGYRLTDTVTGREGEVTAFYDYPNNPLLGVEFEGREVLVPLAIVQRDDRRRTLASGLPEGLLDLE